MKKRLPILYPNFLKSVLVIATVAMFCVSTVLTVLAEVNYELKPSYSVGNIKVYEPAPESTQIAAGKIGLSSKGGSCGDIAQAMSILGLNLNEKSLQNLVSNWKGLALPLALYLLASYLPQAKEALVGARTLSQFVASLGGASCESTMKKLERMSLADSKLVQTCVDAKLGDAKNKSQSEIDAAYDECINNPGASSIIKALGGDPEKIGKYISFLDPQSFAKCAAKNAGIKDLTHATAEDLQNATFADRMANVAMLLMPTVDVNFSDGNLNFSTMKIDGKDIAFLDYLKMVQKDLEKDIDALLADITKSNNEQDMLNQMKKFGDKYNLDISGISNLLELIARWGKLIEDGTAGKINLSTNNFICYNKYLTVKDRYLKGELLRQSLVAVKLALLNKMNAIEQAASKAAAIGGGYGCKDAEDKKVSDETVRSIKNAKDTAIQQLDEKIKELPVRENTCKAIGESIRECLMADMNGIIRIYDSENKFTYWWVGDDCAVAKVGGSRNGENAVPPLPDTPPKKGNPEKALFAFSKREFALLGMLFLGLSIIYFAVAMVRSISREEWASVAINGTVILIIIGIMTKLLA